jgi:hypothetical protein
LARGQIGKNNAGKSLASTLSRKNIIHTICLVVDGCLWKGSEIIFTYPDLLVEKLVIQMTSTEIGRRTPILECWMRLDGSSPIHLTVTNNLPNHEMERGQTR